MLCGLGDARLPIALHGAVYKLTKIYEQFGQCFPNYARYEARSARGKVLLCPPNVTNSAMLRNLGKTRRAILTGWAVDANCQFRHQCHAAFPLSDHADFPELLELVRRVQPKKIYTLHGFAADFAQTLRELGYDAESLSQNEQFGLKLSEEHSGRKVPPERAFGFAPGKIEPPSVRHGTEPSTFNLQPSTSRFIDFALTCSRIARESSKLAKVRLVADYLRGLAGENVAVAATWFTGRPFPSNQNKVLQLGWAVLRDALSSVAAMQEPAFLQVHLKHSDLGETAFELLENRALEPSLSVGEVQELFENLHRARGPLAKTPILARALARTTGLEAKYLVKIITGDLRIGLKEGLVEEAVASAFSKRADEIRQANLLLADIGQTAKLAAENRLTEAALVPFRPVKFMLASPEATADAVWERRTGMLPLEDSGAPVFDPASSCGVGLAGSETGAPAASVWLEDKYDGVRCQLHKVGRRAALYSRDLKDITSTFLEVADAARAMSADFIIDGEIVAMRGDEILPFSELQKRLGRREEDLFLRTEVPIKLIAFDLLWLGGQSLLDKRLSERRQALEQLQPLPDCFRLAHITQANAAAEIDAAFEAARGRGNEGLMIKDPGSLYAPGRRGLAWLKLKKAFATLDCVVVGAEYGHGKRNKVLSDYTFAVRDEESGELKTIGKAYSGLTDAEIAYLTQHFLGMAIRQHGRYFEVIPDTVLEIAFDKIQPSDRHSSGLALRFPRIARIRTDKSPEEIDTLATARKLALGAPASRRQ